MLAYSSVSQMGLIAVGVGAALLLPAAAAALMAAVALYALHHGLAKGTLFLGVAAIPAQGAARRWALAAQALPEPWPQVLGWLLPLAAIGTTALMARLILVLAADRPQPRPTLAQPWLAAVALSLALGAYAAPAVASSAVASAALPLALGLALAAAVARLRALRASKPAICCGSLRRGCRRSGPACSGLPPSATASRARRYAVRTPAAGSRATRSRCAG